MKVGRRLKDKGKGRLEAGGLKQVVVKDGKGAHLGPLFLFYVVDRQLVSISKSKGRTKPCVVVGQKKRKDEAVRQADKNGGKN